MGVKKKLILNLFKNILILIYLNTFIYLQYFLNIFKLMSASFSFTCIEFNTAGGQINPFEFVTDTNKELLLKMSIEYTIQKDEICILYLNLMSSYEDIFDNTSYDKFKEIILLCKNIIEESTLIIEGGRLDISDLNRGGFATLELRQCFHKLFDDLPIAEMHSKLDRVDQIHFDINGTNYGDSFKQYKGSFLKNSFEAMTLKHEWIKDIRQECKDEIYIHCKDFIYAIDAILLRVYYDTQQSNPSEFLSLKNLYDSVNCSPNEKVKKLFEMCNTNETNILICFTEVDQYSLYELTKLLELNGFSFSYTKGKSVYTLVISNIPGIEFITMNSILGIEESKTDPLVGETIIASFKINDITSDVFCTHLPSKVNQNNDAMAIIQRIRDARKADKYFLFGDLNRESPNEFDWIYIPTDRVTTNRSRSLCQSQTNKATLLVRNKDTGIIDYDTISISDRSGKRNIDHIWSNDEHTIITRDVCKFVGGEFVSVSNEESSVSSLGDHHIIIASVNY